MGEENVHRATIDRVIAALGKYDIDLYLIMTAEDHDPITKLLLGMDTIGASAFLFTGDGGRLAITTVIEAQKLEESNLFDQVLRCQTYDAELAAAVKRLRPKKIALNYSDTVALCDGLTYGRYERFRTVLPEARFDICSSDLFIPEALRLN